MVSFGRLPSPEEHLSFEHTALVVFDMLETYRARIDEAGTLPQVIRLVARCREIGMPLMFARADHRQDGADFAATLADVDIDHRPWSPDHPRPTQPKIGSGHPGLAVLPELGQRPEDYDLPKHRWSAFQGTHLELSLRSRGVDTILLVGGSTHVGIAATVYAGRDMDFQVIVVSDGCHGREPQRSFCLDQIFPRVCRVRTADEVLIALC